MALRQADRLESNNPKAFGIVKATQISGHRTVTTLTNLYGIPDCILSDTKVNTDSDAIGQEWYVISERCKYILVDWEKRREKNGWKKYSGIESSIEAGDRIQIERNPDTDAIKISAESEIDDTLESSSSMVWSIDKLKSVINGLGVKLVKKDEELKLEVNVDGQSIGIDSEDSTLHVLAVDGGTYN